MSAYIVSDKTINVVLPWIRKFAPWGQHSVLSETSSDELGKLMFAMNVAAIEERYGQGQAGTFRALDYEFRIEATVEPIVAFKALSCFLYQCNEGEIPRSSLYKALFEIKGFFAIWLIQESIAYAEAPWGLD